MIKTRGILVVAIALFAPLACWAGHSRHPYLDGGQSQDGRYVVTAKLIQHRPEGKRQPPAHTWEYLWQDRRTNRELRGELVALRSGQSSVFEPVHAHIFVAPDGETFAVWNPQVLAPTQPTQQKPPDDRSSAAFRAWSGFEGRLVIYRKTGEIVKKLDLGDFLRDSDWEWLFVYGRQVYWQLEFPGLTRDNAPRVGYALYQISPDYTLLELRVGATAEAARKAAERGVAAPPARTVLVDLRTGSFLKPEDLPAGSSRKPGRPFVGEPITSGGRGRMSDFLPSLDPVRIPGKFAESSAREPNAKD